MTTPGTTKLPSSVDIAIVGGGIIGLSVAYEAATAGLSVVVVERRRCGSGATPVAAGMLAPVSEAEPTLPGMIKFGLESCRLYADFVARAETDSGMRCGYRTEGTLSIAVDRDQMEDLEHRAAAHEELGLEADRLSAREVLQLEPGHAICPGCVDGPRMDRVIAAQAAAAGASDQEVRESYIRQTSLRTFVDAEDIANMVLFLCGPAGARISGQALAVDGHTESLSD